MSILALPDDSQFTTLLLCLLTWLKSQVGFFGKDEAGHPLDVAGIKRYIKLRGRLDASRHFIPVSPRYAAENTIKHAPSIHPMRRLFSPKSSLQSPTVMTAAEQESVDSQREGRGKKQNPLHRYFNRGRRRKSGPHVSVTLRL